MTDNPTTPWRQGYAAGYRDEPMVMPRTLESRHWNDWSSGYLVGQRDGFNAGIIDDLEREFSK